jgi:hypothetical protein
MDALLAAGFDVGRLLAPWRPVRSLAKARSPGERAAHSPGSAGPDHPYTGRAHWGMGNALAALGHEAAARLADAEAKCSMSRPLIWSGF